MFRAHNKGAKLCASYLSLIVSDCELLQLARASLLQIVCLLSRAQVAIVGSIFFFTPDDRTTVIIEFCKIVSEKVKISTKMITLLASDQRYGFTVFLYRY